MEYSLADQLLEQSLINALRVKNPDEESDQKWIYFLNEEKRLIPRGLLEWVKNWAKSQDLSIELEGWPDRETFPVATADLVPTIQLRDYQIETIDTCLAAEAGIIEIATGGGKTEIAIGLTLSLNKRRTLFVCPDIASMRGMYSRYLKREFTTEEVGRLGGGYEEADRQIVVAVVSSIYSGIKRGNSEVLDLLDDCELLLADEVHHKGTAKSWQIVASACQARYRFGMSGTPYKDSSSRDSMKLHAYDTWLTAYTGETLVSITPAKLQARGMLAPCTYIPFRVGGELISGWKWSNVYQKGILDNYSRNYRCAILAANLFDLGAKVLLSITRLEHGRLFQYMLGSMGIQAVCAYGGDTLVVPRSLLEALGDPEYQELDAKALKFKVPRQEDMEADYVQVDAELDVLAYFESGVVDLLIGSTIFDESSDIPFLTDLINAGGGKSPQRFRQKIGRVLRKYKNKSKARVWDPIDRTHKFLSHHSDKRRAIVEEEGYDILEPEPIEMFSVRLSALDIHGTRKVDMRLKTITVNYGLTIPWGDYGSLKPSVSLGAELEEGEDLDKAFDNLSSQAAALFLRSVNYHAYYQNEIQAKGPAGAMNDYLTSLGMTEK